MVIFQLPGKGVATFNSQRQCFLFTFQFIKGTSLPPLFAAIKEEEPDKQRGKQNDNQHNTDSPCYRIFFPERNIYNRTFRRNTLFGNTPLLHHVPVYHIFLTALSDGYIRRLLTMQNTYGSTHFLFGQNQGCRDISAKQFFIIAECLINCSETGACTYISNIDRCIIAFHLEVAHSCGILTQSPDKVGSFLFLSNSYRQAGKTGISLFMGIMQPLFTGSSRVADHTGHFFIFQLIFYIRPYLPVNIRRIKYCKQLHIFTK